MKQIFSKTVASLILIGIFVWVSVQISIPVFLVLIPTLLVVWTDNGQLFPK